jgi:hypothetical protein
MRENTTTSTKHIYYRGAGKVMTLEYGNYVSHFPNLEFIKPKEFGERYLSGTLDKFDAVFTHSSLEHSGLGIFLSHNITTLNPIY